MDAEMDNDTRGWIMCVTSGIGECPDCDLERLEYTVC
jgi:hypothetical protein